MKTTVSPEAFALFVQVASNAVTNPTVTIDNIGEYLTLHAEHLTQAAFLCHEAAKWRADEWEAYRRRHEG